LKQAKVNRQILVSDASYGSDCRRYDLVDVALLLVSFMKYFLILPVVTFILLRLLWGIWREPASDVDRNRLSA